MLTMTRRRMRWAAVAMPLGAVFLLAGWLIYNFTYNPDHNQKQVYREVWEYARKYCVMNLHSSRERWANLEHEMDSQISSHQEAFACAQKMITELNESKRQFKDYDLALVDNDPAAT